jgi:hypothetical protein
MRGMSKLPSTSKSQGLLVVLGPGGRLLGCTLTDAGEVRTFLSGRPEEVRSMLDGAVTRATGEPPWPGAVLRVPDETAAGAGHALAEGADPALVPPDELREVLYAHLLRPSVSTARYRLLEREDPGRVRGYRLHVAAGMPEAPDWEALMPGPMVHRSAEREIGRRYHEARPELPAWEAALARLHASPAAAARGVRGR